MCHSGPDYKKQESSHIGFHSEGSSAPEGESPPSRFRPDLALTSFMCSTCLHGTFTSPWAKAQEESQKTSSLGNKLLCGELTAEPQLFHTLCSLDFKGRHVSEELWCHRVRNGTISQQSFWCPSRLKTESPWLFSIRCNFRIQCNSMQYFCLVCILKDKLAYE